MSCTNFSVRDAVQDVVEHLHFLQWHERKVALSMLLELVHIDSDVEKEDWLRQLQELVCSDSDPEKEAIEEWLRDEIGLYREHQESEVDVLPYDDEDKEVFSVLSDHLGVPLRVSTWTVRS